MAENRHFTTTSAVSHDTFSKMAETLSVIQIPPWKKVKMTARLILLRNTHSDS